MEIGATSWLRAGQVDRRPAGPASSPGRGRAATCLAVHRRTARPPSWESGRGDPDAAGSPIPRPLGAQRGAGSSHRLRHHRGPMFRCAAHRGCLVCDAYARRSPGTPRTLCHRGAGRGSRPPALLPTIMLIISTTMARGARARAWYAGGSSRGANASVDSGGRASSPRAGRRPAATGHGRRATARPRSVRRCGDRLPLQGVAAHVLPGSRRHIVGRAPATRRRGRCPHSSDSCSSR